MWAIDRHDRWGCKSSAQQGSAASALMVFVFRCHFCCGIVGNIDSRERYHILWLSLAPMKGLWALRVPQVPCVRTESPQPVSSAQSLESTDEMQLREVGKLAVHLRKMQWLQKPSCWALPRAVRSQGLIASWGWPSGRSSGMLRLCLH